jgi:hypothetical protein
MNMQQQALLEQHGWTVECLSPLEIRHTDGSFATQQAAHYALEAITSATEAADAPSQKTQPFAQLHELAGVVLSLRAIGDTARKLGDEEAWKTAFDLVFGDEGAGKVRALIKTLDVDLSWDDPDSSYEDDVEAYLRGVESLASRLAPFAAALAEPELSLK